MLSLARSGSAVYERSCSSFISRSQQPSRLFRGTDTYTRTGLSIAAPDHTRVTPLKLPGSHGVWIPPLVGDLIVGEIDSRADVLKVSSIQIPGYWIHKDHDLKVGEPPRPGEKIVYYTHG